jgi:hypothetical protein
MAKHEPALEGTYKFSTASFNHYSIKITFADYDTGEIQGYFLKKINPFSFASFRRDSDTKSSLHFSWMLYGSGPVSTLNLTADDLTYNKLHGTFSEEGGESKSVELFKWT